MAQFSLTWDDYKTNVCNGLSILQQNGEFVDMTLAADGHLVKVHQLIMAMASPYIKELISSANCPHPVVFLNKVSYETLCALLEYIYTGEVRVAAEKIDELLYAGRELHIRGLEDMQLHTSIQMCQPHHQDTSHLSGNTISNYSEERKKYNIDFITSNEEITTVDDAHMSPDDEPFDEPSSFSAFDVKTELDSSAKVAKLYKSKKITTTPVMQYTVSNQGRLQMILNRFIYYLKHTNLNKTQQWRCVDYLNNIKCPAYLVTKGDVVLQRISMHTHPFHDEKILKKVRNKSVYSAIHEAEERSVQEKKSKDGQSNNIIEEE